MTGDPKPEILSRAQLLDRLAIFLATREFYDLQTEGRRLAGSSQGLESEAFWIEPMKSLWAGPAMSEWRERVYKEAHAQGIAGWAIELACLHVTEDPGVFLSAPTWPAARIVTPFDDKKVLNRLLFWSFELIKQHGLQVQVAYSENGQEHRVVVPRYQLYVPRGGLKLPDRPDRESVITVHTWFPPSVLTGSPNLMPV